MVTADQDGRCPVFRIDIADGDGQQLTIDDYAYTNVDRRTRRRALRAAQFVRRPPHPVRIDPDGAVTPLPCVEHAPAARPLTEVRRRPPTMARRCDRGWCCRTGEAPAPLAAVGSRRTAGQLELLALAMESMAAGGTRLRGAASGSRRCRPATDRTSSSEAGVRGAVRRSTI